MVRYLETFAAAAPPPKGSSRIYLKDPDPDFSGPSCMLSTDAALKTSPYIWDVDITGGIIKNINASGTVKYLTPIKPKGSSTPYATEVALKSDPFSNWKIKFSKSISTNPGDNCKIYTINNPGLGHNDAGLVFETQSGTDCIPILRHRSAANNRINELILEPISNKLSDTGKYYIYANPSKYTSNTGICTSKTDAKCDTNAKTNWTCPPGPYGPKTTKK